ncbi:hypothetical protein Tco_0444986 [Tanacetum coccineum]
MNRTTALRIIFSYQKINTAEVNAVGAIGGKGNCCFKPSAGVIGDQKTIWHKSQLTMVDQVLENCLCLLSIDYPHRALQNKGIVDSGCSRHMTGNKAYLAEIQDLMVCPVLFGG